MSGEIQQREIGSAGQQLIHHLEQLVSTQPGGSVLGAGEPAFQVRTAVLVLR
jgi:hypothetical protein